MIWPIRSDKVTNIRSRSDPSGPIRSFQPDLPILAASPPLLGSSPTRVWWKPPRSAHGEPSGEVRPRTAVLERYRPAASRFPPSAAVLPMTSRPAEPGVASRSLPLLFRSLHPVLMNHWLQAALVHRSIKSARDTVTCCTTGCTAGPLVSIEVTLTSPKLGSVDG
jgi:hypothetical protein